MSEPAAPTYDFSGTGEILFIDKPLDWTSFDVVKKVRALFNVRKVGHAGTLDPRASGLLIVCTGKKTKTIDGFTGSEKEYTGTFEIGFKTPSFDMETEVSERNDTSAIEEHDVASAVQELVGKQLQTPPMYSALKYGGIPLYRYARSGETVERDQREIDVREFEIIRYHKPHVDFRVVCTKGTYIRSLVDVIGTKLGCGATLTELRRTRIGQYQVRDALTIEQLVHWRDSITTQADSADASCPAN